MRGSTVSVARLTRSRDGGLFACPEVIGRRNVNRRKVWIHRGLAAFFAALTIPAVL